MTGPTYPAPSWKAPSGEEPIRLGISSCLLGQKVRYDGGHKRDSYLTEVLGKWVEWEGVCPEVEIGLGTPRPPIDLHHGVPNPRLIKSTTQEDLTEKMEHYARLKVTELQNLGLAGFVFKRASPSCGMEKVKVLGDDGAPTKNGSGIFARVLMEMWPDLPVEEEGRLGDPEIRERFIERIFCFHRLCQE
ncbi:MAG: DUF523 domain-containing protein [Thermoanaerobaculales bacterium]|nr:DUF523 domain-containing protein [Thermoanaerobaculales bacterium]